MLISFVVLLQYQTCIEALSKGVNASVEHSSTLIASYQPEADLKALIEQYRTGPFRPMAHVYESVAHDESDVVFGIDLRKWADLGTWNSTGTEDKKDTVPPALTTLLTALLEAYPKLPNDSGEKIISQGIKSMFWADCCGLQRNERLGFTMSRFPLSIIFEKLSMLFLPNNPYLTMH